MPLTPDVREAKALIRFVSKRHAQPRWRAWERQYLAHYLFVPAKAPKRRK